MQTLKHTCPCDIDGICPYMDSSGYVNCDWWCSAEEPEDEPWCDEHEHDFDEDYPF